MKPQTDEAGKRRFSRRSQAAQIEAVEKTKYLILVGHRRCRQSALPPDFEFPSLSLNHHQIRLEVPDCSPEPVPVSAAP
jgi:hypothetical protein